MCCSITSSISDISFSVQYCNVHKNIANGYRIMSLDSPGLNTNITFSNIIDNEQNGTSPGIESGIVYCVGNIKIASCCVMNNIEGSGKLFAIAGSSSISLIDCTIRVDKLTDKTGAGQIDGLTQDWTTENIFVIDIEYTQNDIGCYKEPIDLGANYERLTFDFSDEDDNSMLVGCETDNLDIDMKTILKSSSSGSSNSNVSLLLVHSRSLSRALYTRLR